MYSTILVKNQRLHNIDLFVDEIIKMIIFPLKHFLMIFAALCNKRFNFSLKMVHEVAIPMHANMLINQCFLCQHNQTSNTSTYS